MTFVSPARGGCGSNRSTGTMERWTPALVSNRASAASNVGLKAASSVPSTQWHPIREFGRRTVVHHLHTRLRIGQNGACVVVGVLRRDDRPPCLEDGRGQLGIPADLVSLAGLQTAQL